jgi:hypothetical protein
MLSIVFFDGIITIKIYIMSFYKVHTRAGHIVDWDWLGNVASIVYILIHAFFILFGKLQESEFMLRLHARGYALHYKILYDP